VERKLSRIGVHAMDRSHRAVAFKRGRCIWRRHEPQAFYSSAKLFHSLMGMHGTFEQELSEALKDWRRREPDSPAAEVRAASSPRRTVCEASITPGRRCRLKGGPLEATARAVMKRRVRPCNPIPQPYPQEPEGLMLVTPAPETAAPPQLKPDG